MVAEKMFMKSGTTGFSDGLFAKADFGDRGREMGLNARDDYRRSPDYQLLQLPALGLGDGRIQTLGKRS
jgi:hypothetical protein